MEGNEKTYATSVDTKLSSCFLLEKSQIPDEGIASSHDN